MTRFTLPALAALALILPPLAPAVAQSQTGIRLTVDAPDGVSLDKKRLQLAAIQAMLDRSRHSPGVVDGYMGGNTRRAIRYYRMANGLPKGDAIDDALIKSLLDTQTGDVFRSYTITEDDVNGPFYEVPNEFAAMADMERVGYRNAQELLAERFHMDRDFLAALNPEADFGKAGTKITVMARGDNQVAGAIKRIAIRKSSKSVVAFGGNGKMVASYPATVGSDEFPSPSGSMQVNAVAPEANYTFDPDDQRWGPDKTFVIPPGPNNPIGGVWIDLGKDGYGIHGSPDPQLIGKTASHGCVRLTNWDARELAAAVSQGIPVQFE